MRLVNPKEGFIAKKIDNNKKITVLTFFYFKQYILYVKY